MAEVVCFPLARRRQFIRKQAAWFCDQPHRAAEKNLRHQLEVQRDVMLRRGVDPRSIDGEIEAAEEAIRGEAVRLVFAPKLGPGGAA